MNGYPQVACLRITNVFLSDKDYQFFMWPGSLLWLALKAFYLVLLLKTCSDKASADRGVYI